MSAGDEFIMPVTKPDAIAQMELVVLRQISDAIAQQNRSMELSNKKQDELAASVHALSLSVARIEERDTRAEVKALVIRVDALERIKDQTDGVKSVGGWLSKNMAWLVALGAGVLAALGWRQG